MTGIKDDKQKPMPRLVLGTMARALLEVSKVATFGADKYSADNWLKVDKGIERYIDAKDRHRLEGAISEHDSESGLLHAAHEAWNALAVLELKLRAADAVTESDWPSEERIENIGRNGNDGEVYERQYRDLEKPETWKVGDIVKVNDSWGEITGVLNQKSDENWFTMLVASELYRGLFDAVQSVEARS